MQENELKPCPFCGGKAEIDQFGDSKKSTQYNGLDCGATLETGETFNFGHQWNSRPCAKENCPEGTVVALIELLKKEDPNKQVFYVETHYDDYGYLVYEMCQDLSNKGIDNYVNWDHSPTIEIRNGNNIIKEGLYTPVLDFEWIVVPYKPKYDSYNDL